MLETDTPIPTVYEAWLAVMEDVGAIGKDEKANAGSYSYQFRGVERTVNAVQPVLIKHGVTVIPFRMTADTYEYQTNKNKREEMARVTTTWLVTGPAGDSFQMQSIGAASDGGDKAVVQAASVAQRIGLLQGLQIPTADAESDPDHHHPERSNPADDDEAKAQGWQDAAQRRAVWEAILPTALALPGGAENPIVAPWAKEVGLSPSALTVEMSEAWKAKITEAQAADGAKTEPAAELPLDDFATDEERIAAFEDLGGQMAHFHKNDYEAIEKWMNSMGLLTPMELTKALAAEWFDRISMVKQETPAAEPKAWKSKAEAKRTWDSLLARQQALPDIIEADVIDWGRGNGLSKDGLTPELAEEWLAQILTAEAQAEAPFP